MPYYTYHVEYKTPREKGLVKAKTCKDALELVAEDLPALEFGYYCEKTWVRPGVKAPPPRAGPLRTAFLTGPVRVYRIQPWEGDLMKKAEEAFKGKKRGKIRQR